MEEVTGQFIESYKIRKKVLAFLKRYEWVILISLTVISWVTGYIGFWIYFKETGEVRSLTDIAYVTFQLFTFESGFIDGHAPLILDFARFLAPFTLAYAAFIAFMWIIEHRYKLIKLKWFKNHTVIIGLGKSGMQLLKNMQKDDEKIVVVTKEELAPADRPDHMNTVFIVKNIKDKGVLEQVRIGHAKYVMCMAVDEQENLANGNYVNDFTDLQKPENTTKIFIQTSPYLIEQLHALDYGDKASENINVFRNKVHYFSIYDRAARLIVEEYAPDKKYPDDFLENSKIQAHILIAGFGALGQAVLLQAGRLFHFANRNKLKATVIYNQSKEVERFTRMYPEVDKVIDLNFISFEETNRRNIRELTGNLKIHTIYICSVDETVAIEAYNKVSILLSKTNWVLYHENREEINNIQERIFIVGFGELGRSVLSQAGSLFRSDNKLKATVIYKHNDEVKLFKETYPEANKVIELNEIPFNETNKGNILEKAWNSKKHTVFICSADKTETKEVVDKVNKLKPKPEFVFCKNNPDDSLKSGKIQEHILIVGFKKLGQAALLQAGRLFHFIKGNKLKATVIYNDIDDKEKFIKDYPEAKKVIDLDFISFEETKKREIREKIRESEIHTIYICFAKETEAKEVYKKFKLIIPNTELVFCHENPDDFTGRINRAEHFNLNDKVLKIDNIVKEKIDQQAMLIHQSYQFEENTNNDEKSKNLKKMTRREWKKLPEPIKNQNRSQAEHINIKLRAVGCKHEDDPDINLKKLYDFKTKDLKNKVELLAEMEHRRWNAEQLLNGWIVGERNNDLKIHNNIVSYSDLDESTKEYDRDAVTNIPVILAEIKKKVIPKP
jgi:FlaA1/EpsC-like NDP-sugar epimerase